MQCQPVTRFDRRYGDKQQQGHDEGRIAPSRAVDTYIFRSHRRRHSEEQSNQYTTTVLPLITPINKASPLPTFTNHITDKTHQRWLHELRCSHSEENLSVQDEPRDNDQETPGEQRSASKHGHGQVSVAT
jgi:hypothetical protein